MRVVFVGAGSLTRQAAGILVRRGHEVVVIERDRERIEAVSEELDCGFLHGDGTRPQVLREADPAHADLLLSLTSNDQTNIIASLVGRSLGFPHIVTRIESEEFEHICIELGLQQTVIPARTIGRYLADTAEGHDIMELTTAIKGEARLFLFVVAKEDEGTVGELDLPSGARVSHFFREGELFLPDPDTRLAVGDEVVVVTHRRNLDALRERWGQRSA